MDIENSFFHNDYSGTKVLMIIPHQDDEINVAGGFIKTLAKSKASITIVYTTNGDWKYFAETRMKEAISANEILGVHKEDIIFLGYGDSVSNGKRDHIFYSDNDIAISSSGHSETYGTKISADYYYKKTGEHHQYLSTNYLDDLVSVILEIKPNVIICSDFDEHPDHRMLSLYMDRAIGIVRKKKPDYIPELWKGFAYSTAYTASQDYSMVNNPETPKPQIGKTGKYSYDLIGTSIYSWESRVRIPLDSECRIAELKNNALCKALHAHKSQSIVTRADRIINSDEVFWIRRTDNLSLFANVIVSSGNGSFLNDFMIYDVEDIDKSIPVFNKGIWIPDDTDLKKTAVFSWDTPQSIQEVVLFGALGTPFPGGKITISFDDGYSRIITVFPPNGRPLHIYVGEHDFVSSCAIHLEIEAPWGFSEVEFYSKSDWKSIIHPFCKILINDNFAYEYELKPEIEEVVIDTYVFGNVGTFEISVTRGSASMKNNRLLFQKEWDEVCVAAKDQSGCVLDSVIVRKGSELNDLYSRKIDHRNRRFLYREKLKQKTKNAFYILKKQGLIPVIKRVISNLRRRLQFGE